MLPGVSLAVPRGVVTGLLGPSGSGKTTLMRAIVGVQIVAGGDVTVLGLPAGSPPLRSRVAYVTQAPSVYADLTVRENLEYFAAHPRRARRPHRGDDRARSGSSARPTRSSARCRAASGRAASLAVALLHDPELLVLDEPTVGLDPVLRGELWATFHALAAEGRTLLVSTHVMDEAERCDELVLMREGRIVASGTPAALREETGADTVEQAFIALAERVMSPRATLATAHRVARQLRRDHRTLALVLVVPPALLALLAYVLDRQPATFDRIGAPLVGVFPLIVMFLVTSIAMLRERTGGTLERLMSMPMAKLDLLLGYGLAFAAVGALQAGGHRDGRVRPARRRQRRPRVGGRRPRGRQRAARDGARPVRERVRDQRVPGRPVHARVHPPPAPARRPVRAARPRCRTPLQAISGALPFTYAYDALAKVAADDLDARLWLDVAVVAGCIVLALALGATTLRRRTA